MIIIGEKINGSIPSMGKAIAERNEEYIKEIARKQDEAGATYIDVCASVAEDVEVETMKWLIDLVQSVSDLPIAVDSPSAEVIAEAYKFCNKPGILNSVSGEGNKMDVLFPIMKENPEWECVALLSDDTGIPQSAEDRLKVFDKIMAKAKEYDIAPSRLHIDPLIEMLCTSEDGISIRKPEYHDITSLDTPDSLKPAVFVLNESRIGLFPEHYVMRKRNRQRSLRQLGTVCQFAYEEMISSVESLLHRR